MILTEEEKDGLLKAWESGTLQDLIEDVETALLEKLRQQEPAGVAEVPPNSLPTWGECALRVGNSDFIAKRAAEGGYGPEPDSKLATQLHRFIYEYDDKDPYRSAWFLHRLELVLEEAKQEACSAPDGMKLVPVRPDGEQLTAVREAISYARRISGEMQKGAEQ